jgi:ATP-dependent RNA helicase RhlE
MSKDFSYRIGGSKHQSNQPYSKDIARKYPKKKGKGGDRSFNGRKRRGGGDTPKKDGRFGFAERKTVVPPLPDTPPPAVFEANVFGSLDVHLQHAIADVGYAVPTPIQAKAIPELLGGRDLIGCAQTGTGKTAAFMLPILHHLINRPKEVTPGHPRALVLSPTRELAAQIAENVGAYSKYTGRPWAVVFGGVGQGPQVKAMRAGAETVVATPGRLMDLMTQGEVYLDRVEFFVLDEADRMLDMGFLPDIQRIISKLPPNTGVAGAFGEGGTPRRQSLFFSATLSPQILKLAGDLVVDPIQIMIDHDKPTVENIAQSCMFVERNNKDSLLAWLLDTHCEWYRVIVFCRTRRGADRVERKLNEHRIPVAAIHSDKSQNQRTRALQGFKSGKVRVLVATDIASRGIDVAGVDLVVNMELPAETESYVHRIGRTARAGESGIAISLVASDERGLLKGVEKFIKKSLRIDRDHPYHSDGAERKAGKSPKAGLPTAPWIRGSETNANGKERVASTVERPQGGRDGAKKGGRFSSKSDFTPSSKGGNFRPDGKMWLKKEGSDKFVHPANKKRHRPARKSFKGRRQPDFGQ